MENCYHADWALLVLNIWAYYLIGCKKSSGFILGLVGCIIGMVLFTLVSFSIPMIIMYVLFGTLNIINYLKWQKSSE